MASNKRSKYAAELERIRTLNAIKEVLKKSDIENAALTNTSKDSETVSDNSINNMLNELNLDKNSTKDLEIVEALAVQKKGAGKSDLLDRKSLQSAKHTASKKNLRSAKHSKLKGKSPRKKR